MKKFKISPNASVVSVETLKAKFERLASSVGDNGLTPNFQYIIIAGAYGVKAGINPQTNKPLEYPIIKSVKIGTKSNKISGLSELSINSLKRTINIEDSTGDVIDFTSVLPNCSELNSLQILESLPSEKMFAIVPNGAVISTTNFDSTARPRSIYKVIEITDETTINNVLETAKTAGIITFEEPEEAEKKPK
jgi:hypothetical protein